MNHYRKLPSTGASPETSTTSLFLFRDVIPSDPDPDLLIGFITIVAACTPYFLALIFPDFINEEFFLPVYKDTEEGREAEIGWKVRYADIGTPAHLPDCRRSLVLSRPRVVSHLARQLLVVGGVLYGSNS